MHPLLRDCLICPRCQASASEGFQVDNCRCRRCEQDFFELRDLLCLFPKGVAQKLLWEDLLAKFTEQNEAEDSRHAEQMAAVGLLPATRARMQCLHEVRAYSQRTVAKFLRDAGLQACRRDELNELLLPDGFSPDFELMLRDWAWQPVQRQSAEHKEYEDANRQALASILSVLPESRSKLKRVLVIDADRLSWDLHCALQPQLTLALDSNPVPAYLAKVMVQDRGSIELAQTRLCPQQGLPAPERWRLAAPEANASLQESWQVVAADVWSAPLAPGAFDLVVTHGFTDVSGRDVKQLLALVEKLLAPGGCWLNSGPLPCCKALPEAQRYTPAELRELLQLARFDLVSERFSTSECSHSPLGPRGQKEETWTFLAQSAPDRRHRSDGGDCDEPLFRDSPPSWLVLPHLAIPRLQQEDLFPDWMDNITRLIDGTRSVNDLAAILAASMPEGQDPHQFVYQIFDEFVLQ